jgi:hypothetical protein
VIRPHIVLHAIQSRMIARVLASHKLAVND